MSLAFDFPPVDCPITQEFRGKFSGYPHRGVDFGCVVGTPVRAPAEGVVCNFFNSLTEWQGQTVRAFGTAVCIDHGEDEEFRYSLYAHLSSATVEVNDHVSSGDIIGYTGNTGVSTGPHLHWQLCVNNQFSTNILYSTDPIALIGVADLTPNEVRGIIKEMQNSGDLASTTDVLSCIAQIVGAEDLTYSDTKRVESIREAIKDLAKESSV